MASEKVVHVTDASFDEEVLQHKGVVLVDFWAPWCGPCVAMSPVIDQLAEEFDGKLKVCKLDTQDNPDSAMKYNVTAIPFLMVFRDGKVERQEIGAKSLQAVKSMLEPLLA
jgi:thioredoxin 1